MDKPLGAVDERTRHHLREERLWEREKRTVIFVTHNIDEAVFLAERVLVMGDRPSRIVGEMAIDLRRPRKRLSEGFSRHLRQLCRLLEEGLNT